MLRIFVVENRSKFFIVLILIQLTNSLTKNSCLKLCESWVLHCYESHLSLFSSYDFSSTKLVLTKRFSVKFAVNVEEPYKTCKNKKTMVTKKVNYFSFVCYYSHVIITQSSFTSVSSPRWKTRAWKGLDFLIRQTRTSNKAARQQTSLINKRNTYIKER